MVQEQWVQLKMKILLSYKMEFLLSVGMNFRWRDTGKKFLQWIFPGGEDQISVLLPDILFQA